jgi:hypothetical protein
VKKLLKRIDDCTELYRDTSTGIAWVENGHTGNGHSAHPNIDVTGSVKGMISRGYWKASDKTVRSHGFIYNTSRLTVTDDLDELARRHCQCGGNHSA